MIFFNDEKIYFNCFDFLISDYDYRITYRNTKDGLHSSELILENDKKPKIKIGIENGYLDLYIFIDDEAWPLCMLYKFLHHDKIVRRKFGNSTIIKKYFKEVTKKYLDDVFEQFSLLDIQKLNCFYKEFPDYVFIWS